MIKEKKVKKYKVRDLPRIAFRVTPEVHSEIINRAKKRKVNLTTYILGELKISM